MARSADWFCFACDRPELKRLLRALAGRHPRGAWRVRLTLARSGATELKAEALAPTAEPVLFALADQRMDTSGADSEFMTHKTTRREHYESRASKQGGVFDTLLQNERGELTEFTRGNLALKLHGQWQTPAATCGLLAGTLRGVLLAQGLLAEAVLTPADLPHAEEVVFFNSVRGWLRGYFADASANAPPELQTSTTVLS
jgi:para-aminobenzoate synthetase/4-amino-4-deoxychorismate lyase